MEKKINQNLKIDYKLTVKCICLNKINENITE